MKGTIIKKLRVYDPEKRGEEVIFKDIAELRQILHTWLITDEIIELAYGTRDVKYVMTRDRIADHLSDGHMGEDLKRFGIKHQRAKILLAHLEENGYS
tara:strand:- start:7190 stop:7483 length:294 start_codon:yes stop_codon:yes gene_type:complete